MRESFFGNKKGGTGDAGREHGSQSARQEQAFYLPRERKCLNFYGSVTAGALLVEEVWLKKC